MQPGAEENFLRKLIRLVMIMPQPGQRHGVDHPVILAHQRIKGRFVSAQRSADVLFIIKVCIIHPHELPLFQRILAFALQDAKGATALRKKTAGN